MSADQIVYLMHHPDPVIACGLVVAAFLFFLLLYLGWKFIDWLFS